MKDRFKPATVISREIKNTNNINISRQTVSRRLNEIGLYSRSPVKKPLISKKNKKLRFKFGINHVLWDYNKWSNVFFSDECKFNLIGTDGKMYVRRFNNEKISPKCVINTVKFGGGSIMVFGMFSSRGTVPLTRINVKINTAIYKNILQKHVITTIKTSGVINPIFVQDNAPCHKAKSVLKYLKEEKIEVMDWPAQSPDLNPIENLWHIVKIRVMAKNPSNIDILWKYIQEEWKEISLEKCSKLVRSCINCTEMIKYFCVLQVF